MPLAGRTIGLVLASLLFGAGASHGAEISVMTSVAFTAAYLELKPQFERVTQNKIITLATTMGTGPDYIPSPFNAANLWTLSFCDDVALDELIEDGKVLSGVYVSTELFQRLGDRLPDCSRSQRSIVNELATVVARVEA